VHAGHHTEQFRRRFWVTLALSVPVVATSPMVMDWFGYHLDLTGIGWSPDPRVGRLLVGRMALPGRCPSRGRGSPARDDAADRHGDHGRLRSVPRDSLDAFDLDFWWELSLLVTIMPSPLAGDEALGQAQDALAALAALLPDEAERVTADGPSRPSPSTTWRPATWCSSAPGPGPADGTVVDGAPSWTSR